MSTYATVLLVAPLIAAQDPEGVSPPAQALRRAIAVLGLEATSRSAGVEIYEGVFEDVLSAFVDHVDVSPSGEDFLGIVASHVGGCLERSARGGDDPERAWRDLEEVYTVLDNYLWRISERPRLLAWLLSVRPELEGAESVESLRAIVDVQLADVVQDIALAHRASLL
ncbi:MAG: hypothetical protein AAGC53_20475 [Actinomycetota bacterium]